MYRFVIATFLGILLLDLTLQSCKHEPLTGADVDPDPTDTMPSDTTGTDTTMTGNPCDPDSVYYQNEIQPLLTAYCTTPGCHGGSNPAEGVNLTSYSNLVNTVEDVSNQDWSENQLMEVLFLNDPDEKMPPQGSPQLTLEQKNKIAQWVGQGALNNACDNAAAGCDTTAVSFSGFLMPLIQNQCLGCHGNSNPSAGIKLTNYTEVKAVAVSGKLYNSVTRTVNWMPSGGVKLDGCNVSKIKSWVNAGSLNN